MMQVLIYSPDGRCLFKYHAYESGLGVKSVSWSPCGQFLAVGSYDQMLRVLNHLTWKTFAEFMHLTTVRGPCFAAVFKVIFCYSLTIKVLSCFCLLHNSLSFIPLICQEIDEPLQLDMSELCLSDDLIQGNNGKPYHIHMYIYMCVFVCVHAGVCV